MTGIEILKAPLTTAEQIADIISSHCPPLIPANCDRIACRDCWLAWLTETPPQDDKIVYHIISRKQK